MNNARLKAIKEARGYHILPVKAGQLIEIHETVGTEGNLRTWKFRGMVLKVKKPNHPDGTFTIRGKIAGMTIEKIYPLSFDKFEKVILLDEFKTRRSKLYYLRDKVGRAARMTTIASADEKGVDLLVVAKDAAKEAKEAWDAQQASAKEEAPETADEATTTNEEATSEASAEETKETEAATQETDEAPANKDEQETKDESNKDEESTDQETTQEAADEASEDTKEEEKKE